jgi:hypothetical protein
MGGEKERERENYRWCVQEGKAFSMQVVCTRETGKWREESGKEKGGGARRQERGTEAERRRKDIIVQSYLRSHPLIVAT